MEEEEIGEHVDEDDDDTADHEIAHAHACHANALDRGQNEMPPNDSCVMLRECWYRV